LSGLIYPLAPGLWFVRARSMEGVESPDDHPVNWQANRHPCAKGWELCFVRANLQGLEGFIIPERKLDSEKNISNLESEENLSKNILKRISNNSNIAVLPNSILARVVELVDTLDSKSTKSAFPNSSFFF